MMRLGSELKPRSMPSAASEIVYTSQLYWYTDLEAAKAQAKRLGKPILSLRLLGKLTDEFSCANSRFFRTHAVRQ